MLKIIVKFFKLLNSHHSPSSIAWGLSLGFLMAQYPALNIQWFLLLVMILFFLNINLTAFTFFIIVFKLIPPILDSIANKVGIWLLKMNNLHHLFTTLFNKPFFYLTKFYNSIVMGYTILFIPVLIILFFFFKFLIQIYRDKLQTKIIQSKMYKAFIRTPIVAKFIKLSQQIKLR